MTNPFLAAIGAPTTAPPAVAVQQPDAAKQIVKETQPSQLEQPSTETEKNKRKRKKNERSPAKTPPNNTISPPANKKPKEVSAVATPIQKQHPTNANPSAPPSFRDLQLPIASFSLPLPANTGSLPDPRPPTPQHELAPPPPPMPLPIATPAHLYWKDAVIATRKHENYGNSFNFERAKAYETEKGISVPSDWVATKPYGAWCASNPAAIALDFEMCLTKHPTSGAMDPKALCRVSIVNADNPDEVLLDTLVKPDWPVKDYRTWVNGIAEKDLENVQFTLKHAQQFMLALCSDQTVVVGHAVHNDLLALRMVHECNVDTAMLYSHNEEGGGSCSLKNLAHGALGGREMPDVHDSVNDSRVALACAKHYVDNDGKVDPIEKVFTKSYGGPRRGSSDRGRIRLDAANTTKMLVHRLPTGTLAEHLSEMFLAYTNVKPKKVEDIIFTGIHGKCRVEFTSEEHAELAYVSLAGEEREDKAGNKQKRVGLKGGGYVCVRKI